MDGCPGERRSGSPAVAVLPLLEDWLLWDGPYRTTSMTRWKAGRESPG